MGHFFCFPDGAGKCQVVPACHPFSCITGPHLPHCMSMPAHYLPRPAFWANPMFCRLTPCLPTPFAQFPRLVEPPTCQDRQTCLPHTPACHGWNRQTVCQTPVPHPTRSVLCHPIPHVGHWAFFLPRPEYHPLYVPSLLPTGFHAVFPCHSLFPVPAKCCILSGHPGDYNLAFPSGRHSGP